MTSQDELAFKKKIKLIEKTLEFLLALVGKRRMYPDNHPIIKQSLDKLNIILTEIHKETDSFAIGIVDGKFIFEDTWLKCQDPKLTDSLNRLGIDTLTFRKGITYDELSKMILFFSEIDKKVGDTGGGVSLFKEYGIANIQSGKIDARRKSGDMRQPPPPKPEANLALQLKLAETIGDEATDEEKEAYYQSTLSTLYSVFENIRLKDILDTSEESKAAGTIIDMLKVDQHSLNLMATLKEYHSETFHHSMNVCILNLLQGINLSLGQSLTKRLAIAGLMHDIGMLSVPKEVLEKKKELTIIEKQLYMLHPVEGAKLMLQNTNVDPLFTIVAFEHHQRFDLKGFPRVNGKKKLNPFSLITAISDSFSHQLSKSEKNASSGWLEIIDVMRRGVGYQFAPTFFKNFELLNAMYASTQYV
jgi:HD-GYP domain-containing protein (c-di-GMP phosphodiesterase class II)